MIRWPQRLSALLEGKFSRSWREKMLDTEQGMTYLGGVMSDQKKDPMVHNPQHYNHGGLEVIDVIDAFSHLHYNLLNAIKYILRAPFKGRQQDLDKAIWYLQHMKDLMDKGEPGYFARRKNEVTE